MVNAVISTILDPWLVGDSFIYLCNGNLVLSGTAENQCMETVNEAHWSLSLALNNLPRCGKSQVCCDLLSPYFFKCLPSRLADKYKKLYKIARKICDICLKHYFFFLLR